MLLPPSRLVAACAASAVAPFVADARHTSTHVLWRAVPQGTFAAVPALINLLKK